MADERTPHDLGREGEALAAAFMEAQGCLVLERNYRFERNEVDLVLYRPNERFETGGELIFVEVKARRSHTYGAPEEAVTDAKKRSLMRAAEAYLHEHRLDGAPARFDVIAITYGPDGPKIDHFPHAFGMFF